MSPCSPTPPPQFLSPPVDILRAEIYLGSNTGGAKTSFNCGKLGHLKRSLPLTLFLCLSTWPLMFQSQFKHRFIWWIIFSLMNYCIKIVSWNMFWISVTLGKVLNGQLLYPSYISTYGSQSSAWPCNNFHFFFLGSPQLWSQLSFILVHKPNSIKHVVHQEL